MPEDNSITVVLPRLLPGLNGKKGLMRNSKFGGDKALKEAVFYQIREQASWLPRLDTPAKAVLRRYYKVSPMDWDNATASFKYLLDATVKAKIIPDDSPKVIVSITCEQHRVKDKADERMEVTFIPVNNEESADNPVVFL